MASERVERRLMAILAADVAGYSRLVGADEEGTLAQWKAHGAHSSTPRSRNTAAGSLGSLATGCWSSSLAS